MPWVRREDLEQRSLRGGRPTARGADRAQGLLDDPFALDLLVPHRAKARA
jgi:hypothetical protein